MKSGPRPDLRGKRLGSGEDQKATRRRGHATAWPGGKYSRIEREREQLRESAGGVAGGTYGSVGGTKYTGRKLNNYYRIGEGK
jgi:hypothetical protein